MLRLRPLTEEDLYNIKQWPRYPGDMEQMDYALRENGWIDELNASAAIVYVYAVDDEEDDLVAFTLLRMTGDSEAEFRIALRSDKTGQGLGEEIASRTLQLGFEKHGLSRIYLVVRKNNSRGIALYPRVGFVGCGECRKEVHGVLVDFLVMEVSREDFARVSERISNPSSSPSPSTSSG